MPARFNPTRIAASLIIRHGERAEAVAANEIASAHGRGEHRAATGWHEVAEAVRAITAIAPSTENRPGPRRGV